MTTQAKPRYTWCGVGLDENGGAFEIDGHPIRVDIWQPYTEPRSPTGWVGAEVRLAIGEIVLDVYHETADGALRQLERAVGGRDGLLRIALARRTR